jgi:hypothetical protein
MEIFLNPSAEELRSIPSFPEYRFLINFKTKEFYAWHVQMFHVSAMDWIRHEHLSLLPDFNQYWNGKNNDFLFTGSVDPDKTIHSDLITSVIENGDNLKLLKFDFKWMKQYIDIKELEYLLLHGDKKKKWR